MPSIELPLPPFDLPVDIKRSARIATPLHHTPTSHLHSVMVEAYYYAENDSPMTDAHDSGISVSLNKLRSVGVYYSQLPTLDSVNELAEQRHYKNRDVIDLNADTFPGGTQAIQAKLDIFFKEHIHEDEEIRYILQGEGYFDVRDDQDKWIRVKVEKDDMLILPAGIYHRFTLTDKMSVKALRLFKDEPKWIALNREEGITEDNKYRKEYVHSVST
jgi:1,2-dihydroxy-3-keto-5-methylthiopentene dioxygenase